MTLSTMLCVLLASDNLAGLSDWIRLSVGNMLLAGFAVGAAKFAVAKEMVKFFEFAAIAILIGVFVWAPTTIKALAETVGGLIS